MDPSGYDPEFGSTAYGTYVHQQLGFIFKLVNYLGKEVAFTERNVKLVNGKNGRLDYALQVSEHRFEIYELKPVSWMKEKNPELNASAHDQLNGYINGINMNGFRGDSKARAKVGTTWNPNGLVMMSPFNPKKEIVIYSNYALEPGMLYYGERNKQSKESVPEVDPKTVWDKIKDFFSAEYYPTDGVPGPHGLPSLGGGKKKSGGFIPFPPGLPVIPVL